VNVKPQTPLLQFVVQEIDAVFGTKVVGYRSSYQMSKMHPSDHAHQQSLQNQSRLRLRSNLNRYLIANISIIRRQIFNLPTSLIYTYDD